MSRHLNREEALRIAAEKMREKKEREAREEKEIYERITSGTPWIIFTVIAIFCALIAVLTTFDTFVDGPSKKLREADCKLDREWEWTWHRMLDIEGYSFAPLIGDWIERDTNSVKLVYSPIFRAGKKLIYTKKKNGFVIGKKEEIRERSIFDWFPLLQIFMLIPLFTLIFKRQKPWFTGARLFSLYFVFPGTLMAIYYAIY